MPIIEFAFPGPLRDQLAATMPDGSKTSTTSTLAAYEIENADRPTEGR